MIRGLPGAMFAGKKSSAPTARDYVQDGLKAMWDGTENAGRGSHDDSSSAWIEWCEGLVNPQIGSATWNRDSLKFVKNTYTNFGYKSTPTLARDFPSRQDVSVELVYRANSVTEDSYSSRLFDIQTNKEYSRLSINGWNGRENLYVGIAVGFGSPGLLGVSVGRNGIHTYSASFSYDEASDSYSVDVYLDGVFVKNSTTQGSPINDNTWYMLQPQSRDGNDIDIFCTRWYGGKSLTAAEISANYAVDKARFNIA